MFEQLGRYHLTARIATGGMAEVFLARSEGVQGFSKTVVIKRLLPHLARDPQVVEMFLNEARLTGRLDHPNIVQVLDLGQAAGHYYIAMEFLDGRAVAEVRDAARGQGGMLPIGFVLRVFAEALLGLHHAHEARGEDGTVLHVVHRDFNPDNIVVTYDGRVKVVDFGIAKSQGSTGASTEPGTLKGKYFYMSPEMVLGNPLDRRADIFAAGVALYELCCDKRPFEGDTPNAILSGIAYGTAVSPRSLNPTIPPELESLILRCMARAPNERPPTALAVKEELERIAPRVGAFGSGEVSQLMDLLFPLSSDAERRRISELRQIDPSLPNQARIPVAPAPPPPQPAATRPERAVKPQKPSKPLPRSVKLGAGALVLAAGVGLGAWKLAPLLKGKPDPTEAHLEALEKAARAHPEQASGFDRWAEALLAENREGDAESVVDQVLAAHPDDPRAHVLKGDLYARKRFGQKALEEYAKALAASPNDAAALAHQGRLHLARGELGDARNDLARAFKLEPDRQLALDLADLQGRSGDWAAAVSTLGAAAGRWPRDAELRRQLGFASFQAGDDRRAQSELLAADRLKPNHAKTELYLGFVYYRQGKTERAIESYRAAVAHASTPVEAAPAHAALGQILLAKGERETAKAELAAAVKADPSLTDAAAALKKLP